MGERKIISECECVYPSKTDLCRRKRDKHTEKGDMMTKTGTWEGDGAIGQGKEVCVQKKSFGCEASRFK